MWKNIVHWLSCCCWDACHGQRHWWDSFPLAENLVSYFLCTPSVLLDLLIALFSSETENSLVEGNSSSHTSNNAKSKEMIGWVRTCKTEEFMHPGTHIRKSKCWEERLVGRCTIKVFLSSMPACFYSAEIRWYFFSEYRGNENNTTWNSFKKHSLF